MRVRRASWLRFHRGPYVVGRVEASLLLVFLLSQFLLIFAFQFEPEFCIRLPSLSYTSRLCIRGSVLVRKSHFRSHYLFPHASCILISCLHVWFLVIESLLPCPELHIHLGIVNACFVVRAL